MALCRAPGASPPNASWTASGEALVTPRRGGAKGRVSLMPLFDPDFCENRCPVCTNARKGNRLAKILQRIERVVTFGGCPWGRARQRKYGVPPDEPMPARTDSQE
jgi:hypothetical protein